MDKRTWMGKHIYLIGLLNVSKSKKSAVHQSTFGKVEIVKVIHVSNFSITKKCH